MNVKLCTHLLIFALSFFVISCCKAPEPDFDFSSNTPPNNTAIDPTKSLSLSTTQKAKWAIVSGGGTINANGVYTPPATGTIVTITATSSNSIELRRTFIVTPSFKLINDILKGGHVLSFYHGKSAGTDFTTLPSNTSWWTFASNASKQLTNEGRLQMEATGKALQNMKIKVDMIYTSQFYRCVESARLMRYIRTDITTVPEFVEVKTNDALTYFVYDEPNRYANTMNLIKSLPITEDFNFLLVTHTSFSGNVPTPAPLADLNEGDAAVFKLQPNNGTPVFVGKLTSQELVALQ